MQRIRTWFRARQKRHRNCPGREQSANRPLAVDKPADTPVNKQVNKPKSHQANVSTTSPHVKVQVVSVLDDNDTTTSAVSKGLVKLSNAMKIINDLSLAEGTQSVTDTIADIIINVVNTMTTVHDQQKPRIIHAYHVYATRTAIASFIAIRDLVIKPDQSDSGTSLRARRGYNQKAHIKPNPATTTVARSTSPGQHSYEPRAGWTGEGISPSPEIHIWDRLHDHGGGQHPGESFCPIGARLFVQGQ